MSAADLGPAAPGASSPPTDGTSPAGDPGTERGSGRLILSAFARNWQARVGVATVIVLALFCFVGPLLYRTNQVGVNLNLKDLAPGGSHPLGTDDNGYDVLGRLMLGGQSSLELGFAVAIVTTLIGTAYGAIAGIASGVVDGIMMRIVDTFLAIPWLVLLLIMVNIFPPNLWTIIALLSVLSQGSGIAAAQRCSTRPNRQTPRATIQVAAKRPTMKKPSELMFRPETQVQNGPPRLYSCAMRPRISTVPMISATATDSPVIVMIRTTAGG